MAFTIANWTCQTPSLNQGQRSVVPFGDEDPVVVNAPNAFNYGSPTDTVATIAAANYFLPQYASLSVGDWILVNGTDASTILVVTAVSSTSVTTVQFAASGTVNTANIVNHAVTYAKIQQASAGDVLLGNPTAGPADYKEVPLGAGLEFDGITGALQIPTSVINTIRVNVTAAQVLGMFVTPVLMIASPGPNTLIFIKDVLIQMDYDSAQYTLGGAIRLQYGNGGGAPAATGTLSASDFNGANSSFGFLIPQGLAAGANLGVATDSDIYLTNLTQAFATGDSDLVIDITYQVVPSVV